MNITAEMVRSLRESTGAGMMDCKKVLVETEGDMDKAVELLRERGISKAAKKSSRIAAEGMVAAYVSADQKVGAIVEVNSETDFVAKNPEFTGFVNNVAKIIVEKNPSDVESLKAMEYENGESVETTLTNLIAKIGENMSLRRFTRFESTGLVQSYIHLGGKIAVLVDMPKGDAVTAKDICMQVAASKPEYLNEKEVPAERLEKEMEILKAQAMNEGKPAEIAEKVVKGRIGSFYSEICLLDQPFVKELKTKVSDMLASKNAEVARFSRLETGEGLEKREENFADEVMKQLK